MIDRKGQLSQAPGPKLLLIDLTPLLPGGENGGAKWFVIGLLQHLPVHLPDWSIMLLTTARNEALLAGLYPRFQRLRIIDESGRLIVRVDPSRLPGDVSADLLFCPFTAPFHASPAVPTVSTVYDLQFNAYPQFFTPAEIVERAGHIADAARVCAILVCISEYVRRDVIAYTGLPESRVRRVHIALPHRLSRAAPTSESVVLAREKLKRNRYLIYPANTWPHKNHAMLLIAFGMWRAMRPDSDLKLVCTGVSDSPTGRDMRNAIGNSGLREHFLMLGFLPEDELAAIMTHARALIFPTLFEGFGMPVVEAMACGLPVLCSNTTSLPEIAGDAAILFDPRLPDAIVDAIRRIEEEPGLAAELSARGRERVGQLGDATSIAIAYAEIFRSVVQAPLPSTVQRPFINGRRLVRALKRRVRAAGRMLLRRSAP